MAARPYGKGGRRARASGTDADHLAIGPTGVFTINFQRHPGKSVWYGDTAITVNGTPTRHIPASQSEARRVPQVLSRRCGFNVPVRPVISGVHAAKLTVKGTNPPVLVLAVDHVHPPIAMQILRNSKICPRPASPAGALMCVECSRVQLTSDAQCRSEIVSRAAGDRFARTRSPWVSSPGQTASVDTRRPCPCCGHLVFDIEDGWPGSFAICPICFWEDDAQQFRWPFMPGGANRVSLVEAQRNFQAYGACDQHGRRFARPSADDEPLDPNWRPIDPAVDFFEDWRSGTHRPWPATSSILCWWLPCFWGSAEEPESEAPQSVVVDVGAVSNDRDLHDILKQELGFPAFYGMNWAAFWDAITGLVEMPRMLRFVHWAELERRAPLAAAALRAQLVRYEKATEGFSVVYDQ